MRSLAVLLLTFVLVFGVGTLLAGCDGVTSFGFVSNFPAGGTADGTVVWVQLSTVNANGTFIKVTSVTLQTKGSPSEFTFCDDHASQFPINMAVTVHFNPGSNCNEIVGVITR